jgi:hypothetical protein
MPPAVAGPIEFGASRLGAVINADTESIDDLAAEASANYSNTISEQ